MERLELVGSSPILRPLIRGNMVGLLVTRALPPVRVTLPLVLTVVRAGNNLV